ncbi:hypothetical protein P4123_04220 [Pseudomonas aeruginosa]|nr:hypothetical protein [Pseudomonas aeruginosa]
MLFAGGLATCCKPSACRSSAVGAAGSGVAFAGVATMVAIIGSGGSGGIPQCSAR